MQALAAGCSGCAGRSVAFLKTEEFEQFVLID
jgi:hypothetical protein